MTLLSIPDMTCGHCRASVTEALTRLPGTDTVEVDLTHKTARVEGRAAPAEMLRALDQIGFPASVLAEG